MQSVTSNAVANAINYPGTEVATGAKWIDGKTIYRKVVDFGSLPNTGHKEKYYGANIDTIVNLYGISSNGSFDITLPCAAVSTREIVSIYINRQGGVVGVETGMDRSGFTTTYIIIEYTKSS